MRKWHVLVIVVVVALAFGAGAGWSAAQQERSSATVLTGQDYAEIYQLYSSYAQGTDFMEAELWLSAFTDDAVFRPGVGADLVIGKAALGEWRADNFAARPKDRQTRHWNSGWVIKPTADGASGRLYFLGVNVSSGQPQLGGSGHYEDKYVKTADGWRIKERLFTQDSSMHWMKGSNGE